MLTLVKFYSDTCAPCKALNPIMEILKEKLTDSVIFTDVNIADNPQLVQEHFVRAVPTILVFKDAIEVGRVSGLVSQEQLEEWIDKFRTVQPEVLYDTSAGVPGAGIVVLRDASEQSDAGEGSS